MSSSQKKAGWLQISSKIDCGLQLLVQLAKNNTTEPLSLRKIADKNGMSFFFLQKVAADLRRAGIIIAGRGKDGGYNLAKSEEKIKMLDIVEAHEGHVSLMPCSDKAKCSKAKKCTIRPGLHFINNTITQTLSKTTLKDFIKLN
jgi:Rrf2 family cysteine metabolism transcriptional repressor